MDKDKRNAAGDARRGFLKIFLLTAGAAAVSPLLSSCSPKQADEYEVDIVLDQGTIHYSPETLRIPLGATVTWLNKCYYSQSATCDPSKAAQGAAASLPRGVQPWSSGLLFPGQRYSRRFDTPGTYVYFSLPRLSPGMIGTIIVG
jgi:plastocyanin